MAKRYSLILLPLLALGCAGDATLAPKDTDIVSGIYMDDHDDLVGLKHTNLVFTFDEVDGEINGGVRAFHTDGGKWKAKALHTALKDADGLITGTVDLGDRLGVATFSGRITNDGFAYTITDNLETVHGVAEYIGEYLKPPAVPVAPSRAASPPDPGTPAYWNGSFHITLGPSGAGSTAYTWNSAYSFDLTTLNAAYDGMGGIKFTVHNSDSIPKARSYFPDGGGDRLGGRVSMSWAYSIAGSQDSYWDMSFTNFPTLPTGGTFELEQDSPTTIKYATSTASLIKRN